MTKARDTAASDLVVARKQAEDQTNRLLDVEGQLQTAKRDIAYLKEKLTVAIHEKGIAEYARDEAVRAKDEAPLARMGATVTGVDAAEKISRLRIFMLHAGLDSVTSTIEYRCTTAEKLVEEDRKFDAVIALEVIEHVANPAEFCKSLAALTVPDGATIISTINRSMRSYATAIVAAEYLLHWLPKGTHEWSSFLTPEELVLILQRANITVREMAGFVYNPLTGRWSLSDDISVNFIAFGTKNCQ
ncbi:ubiquinone biosynthesis O-methyltransferase, mitochondrial-like [Quercus suber]|uniref:ubiquinone biosynthesis O-methyltransferase, mitochondrial-like n=1 Tax=Quercus suber TaxID=58331 RepID=UPI0032DF07DC